MNKAQAIHKFWSGFGLTAYDMYTVPKNAEMPYITYSVAEDSLERPISLTGSIWYRRYSQTDCDKHNG